MAKVGLVFGGRSVEHLVSVQSARTVAEGLRAAGHEVIPLGVAEDGAIVEREVAERALTGGTDALAPAAAGAIGPTFRRLVDSGAEVIFPIVHGTYGEDGTLQGLCAMLDLPCVGAGVAASAVAMDKVLCKRVLRDAGIPVVDAVAVSRADVDERGEAALGEASSWELPLFVKPSVGGSSVGCRKVSQRAELLEAVQFALRFDENALIERAIVGREIECAVLGNDQDGLEASCLGEIVPGKDFYDYEDKYLLDLAGLKAPAELDEGLADRVRACALDAFRAIGGTGMARVDFFVAGDRFWVNEINTLPGFTRISMYPRLWGLSGRPLGDLCGRLVELAQNEHVRRHRLDAAVHGFVEEIAQRAGRA